MTASVSNPIALTFFLAEAEKFVFGKARKVRKTARFRNAPQNRTSLIHVSWERICG
jgi:hypothetical protein